MFHCDYCHKDADCDYKIVNRVDAPAIEVIYLCSKKCLKKFVARIKT